MTLALRAHRLLCRLGLHLDGRWHSRKDKPGQYRVCVICKRDRWQADKTPLSLAGKSFGELVADKSYPVDHWKFPVIDHTPRDGVTHEG